MDYPYLLVLETTLSANGNGTLQHNVPNGETLQVQSLYQVSDGAFNLNDLRTTDGVHYTNATSVKEIPSMVLQDGANGNNGISGLPIPLEVQGGTSLYFEIEDTSGSSNVVTFVLSCIRSTQGR